MKRARRLVFVVFLALCVFCGLWFSFSIGPNEPVYQGRGLREWLEFYNRGFDFAPAPVYAVPMNYRSEPRSEAEAAIRQIGTNALPYLLNMCGYTDSALKRSILAVAWRFRNRLGSVRLQKWFRDYQYRSFIEPARGIQGIRILGLESKHAIPVLTRLLSTSKSAEVRWQLADVLGSFGAVAAEAEVALIQNLSHEHPMVRETSLRALNQIGMNSAVAVPKLVRVLKEPNADIHELIRVLGDFEHEAGEAIPSLVELLEHSNVAVRFEAGKALMKIDPDAAVQTPYFRDAIARGFPIDELRASRTGD